MSEKKKITNISTLQVPSTNTADIYIKKIVFDGDPENKKPLTFLAAIEESNQKFKVVTWDFKLLDMIKESFNARHICTITFACQEYRDNISYKLINFTDTKKETSHTIEDDEQSGENTQFYNKDLYSQLVDQIQNDEYKKLLNVLVLNNKNFFKWPAAKSIHHAFEGGLAKHSYNVTVNAINLANTYENQLSINYDLLIAGALLHDIGKLREYSQTGDFTRVGHFMSHLVLGVEMIDEACDKLGFDKNSEEMILLKHIIVSHHNKLEYGSPNRPIIPEAYIISYADSNDAEVESMTAALYEMNTNEISKSMRSLDDGKLFKLY